jgi:hypothetical protein
MSRDVAWRRTSVFKKTIHQDLIDEYLDDTSKDFGRCECSNDGQEFVKRK